MEGKKEVRKREEGDWGAQRESTSSLVLGGKRSHQPVSLCAVG